MEIMDSTDISIDDVFAAVCAARGKIIRGQKFAREILTTPAGNVEFIVKNDACSGVVLTVFADGLRLMLPLRNFTTDEIASVVKKSIF